MSVTRIGAVVVIAALLVPVGSSAQQLPLPLPGTRKPGPAQPAPLPPQAGPVARNLAYKRMRLAVESYPLVSYVQASSGLVPNWTSFGAGTRADYRLTRHVALTLDFTSSFAGGPADVHTGELGLRFRREGSARTLSTFADVRVGYIAASGGQFNPITGDYGYPVTGDAGSLSFSQGVGAAVGAGMEYALTRSLSLTTSGSVMPTRVTTRAFIGGPPSEHRFNMTLYRYTLGIRYNPVRLIRVPLSDPR